jgi:hypothetical protein
MQSFMFLSPQPPIQWVRGALPRGYSGRRVMLTTHLLLVPRSRMRGATTPPPQNIFMAWCLVKNRNNFSLTFNVPLVTAVKLSDK